MDNETNEQLHLTNEVDKIYETEDKSDTIQKATYKKFSFKRFIGTKKGRFSLGGLGLLFIVFIVIMSQYPMSLDKAYKEYSTRYELMGSDEAFEWLEKEFDGKGLFAKKEIVRKTQVLVKSIDEINQSFINSTGGTVDDFKSVEISEVWFENGGKYSNYKDINTKIINKSQKNITYIKLNIYFEDDKGNIIGSDWTNDSSTIKPNATQTISKMIPKDIKNASVEIADIRFQ